MQQVEWAEYRLGDLFDIENTLSFNKNLLVKGDDYDYVTRTSQNQGVLQKTGFVNNENINVAGNWSLGLLQMDFFYREKPWYAGQFVRKITSKIKLDKKAVIFFTTLLNKQKKNLLSVLVRNVDSAFKKTKIALPIKNNEIDFDFIESFISQLEAFRLSQLEAYLSVTGLKNYTLTSSEEQALTDFRNGKVQWVEFRLGDLFEKVKATSLKYKTNDLPNQPKDKFVLPALTAGIQNQGLNNYVPKEGATILKNVISISANGANTGATFYQNKEFTVLQDAYAIEWKLKEKEVTDNQYLFFVGVISKVIYGNYEWTNKAGWERIKNDKISLLIQNGEIDFDFMETLISAIQKLVIKEVVLYADRKIETTNQIIN